MKPENRSKWGEEGLDKDCLFASLSYPIKGAVTAFASLGSFAVARWTNEGGVYFSRVSAYARMRPRATHLYLDLDILGRTSVRSRFTYLCSLKTSDYIAVVISPPLRSMLTSVLPSLRT